MIVGSLVKNDGVDSCTVAERGRKGSGGTILDNAAIGRVTSGLRRSALMFFICALPIQQPAQATGIVASLLVQ